MTGLSQAQATAAELFVELSRRNLVRAGESEASISEAIFALGERDFGTRRHWHRRVVRSKTRLRDDLEVVFRACRDFYLGRPQTTGAELYEYVVRASAARGWGFGGAHAGHLVGRFPIAREERDAARNRIRPDNDVPMNERNGDGSRRSWILEVHLLDPTGEFGGFFEDVLVE
jgi:Xaa-Pro dipeptidase